MILDRIKGHRLNLATAGKFGHTLKPRCSCGWVGPAGTRSQARSAYAAHQVEVSRSGRTPAIIARSPETAPNPEME